MPELVDIRDEQGNLVGDTMTRQEAHQAEAWHGVALVWVYNSKGEILIQRRASHLNMFPDKWDVTVSGHLTAGDQPIQTAARELGEELGMAVTPGQLHEATMIADTFDMTYGKVHKECAFIYLLCNDANLDDLKLQVAEVQEVRWISVDDFERDLQDPIGSRQYSKRNSQVYQLVIEAARKQQGVAQPA